MKRILLTIAALAFGAMAAFADDIRYYDVNVVVSLQKDGSAAIEETWKVHAERGTEVYLVRTNLGSMKICDLRVRDESGLQFTDIGKWDPTASFSEKAGKCGIAQRSDGCEICWGLGEYGDKCYTVNYTMTNVVKSLSDYDMVHTQFVSDGLNPGPDHVMVTIEAPGVQIDTACARAWGFGYNGMVSFTDEGTVVFESDGRFNDDNSVICLLRFDKGIFESLAEEERSFQDVLDVAMVGADFGDDEDGKSSASGGGMKKKSAEEEDDFAATLLAGLATVSRIWFAFIRPFLKAFGWISKREKRKVLGKNPNKVEWCRDLPYEGNLYMTDYTLRQIGAVKKDNTLASALILRMIYNGYLEVLPSSGNGVEIGFTSKDPETLEEHARNLYNMMLAASGSDRILQKNEFSRWSWGHRLAVRNWGMGIRSLGVQGLNKGGDLSGLKYTAKGKENACKALGFKKFLLDFTLVKEHSTAEAVLWQEYLVFASLFGIADKVAKELKEINLKMYEQATVAFRNADMREVFVATTALATAITSAQVVSSSSSGSSSGGFGGRSSSGGGGGFSGGGRGGGIR